MLRHPHLLPLRSHLLSIWRILFHRGILLLSSILLVRLALQIRARRSGCYCVLWWGRLGLRCSNLDLTRVVIFNRAWPLMLRLKEATMFHLQGLSEGDGVVSHWLGIFPRHFHVIIRSRVALLVTKYLSFADNYALIAETRVQIRIPL